MPLDDVGNVDDRLQARVGRPEEPLLVERECPTESVVAPQGGQRLLDGPGAAGSQVELLEVLEPALVLVRKVLLGIEPEVLRTGQGLDSLGTQLAVLALAHGVDGLAHVLHDVEAVKDDLVLSTAQVFFDRVDVGLPHVHGHRGDAVAFGGTEGIEVDVETGLLAIVGDVLDGAAGDVIDQGEVGVVLAGRLLVHPEEGRDLVFLGRSTPGDGPLHDPPTLVPGHLQDVGGARDVGLLHHVDGEALEGRGEAAAGLGPREADWQTPSVGHLTRGGRARSQVGNPPVSRCRQARISEWSNNGSSASQFGQAHSRPSWCETVMSTRLVSTERSTSSTYQGSVSPRTWV